MDDEANPYARIRAGAAMMKAEKPEPDWRESAMAQLVEIVAKLDAMAKKQDAMIEWLQAIDERSRDVATFNASGTWYVPQTAPVFVAIRDKQQDAGDAI